ncbi:MAG: undecaprenyl/decaprenyl-phosphate alpha-N-acetylglucosaminyl 1-phosphate transferase [Anaerolineales bacterium]|nr:undecaprenyl/decaprenyl-phosphate alpha-N-acetylglucosaminyl 1-phosphate transferase [Anaerolineales bacterium]
MSFLTFRLIFFAALTSLVLSLPVEWLTRRFKWMDYPGSAPHKLHTSPVPVAGGLVILISLLVMSAAEGLLISQTVRAIIIPALIIFLFGLWDDLCNLRARWKFFGQLLATATMIGLGLQTHLFDTMPWIDLLVTGSWMIGVTNAYNFVDSMDGLANGLASLAAAFFMLVTFDSLQNDLTAFSAIMLGVGLGVYYFTAPPARFFLGDSGSQSLGFLLGALAIAYNPLGFVRSQSWFIPILLVGVPLFDAALVVISRLRRKRSVYQSSRDHTYHRLVALGLPPNRAVLTMQVVAGLLGCLAIIALTLPPILANTIFIACVLGGFVGIAFLDQRKRWP